MILLGFKTIHLGHGDGHGGLELEDVQVVGELSSNRIFNITKSFSTADNCPGHLDKHNRGININSHNVKLKVENKLINPAYIIASVRMLTHEDHLGPNPG